jgi:hypothetical protein
MSVPKSAMRRAGESGLRPFTTPPGGGLLPLEAAAFVHAGALPCSGAADFTTDTGLLPPEAVAFALPHARFASRIGSAILTIARRFCAVS